MDKNNIKEMNLSEINDEYWNESWLLRNQLLLAISYKDDSKIKSLLKNPKLFKGRS